MTCADQDPFLFSILREKRNGSSALPHLPFPGLLRDGPPRARLRSAKTALVCHRQRQSSRPPSSFRLAEKKMVRARARRKGRFHAGFLLTIVEPVPADIRPFPKTGCNRGIVCRLCFRAETLRLALRGAGGTFCAPSSRRSPGNPTGARGPPWPFQLGRVKGGEENGIFPFLAPLLLQLFFGRAKKS